MKALVTGGAGFVGSHLCDKLLEQGYEVMALDNLLTGLEENLAPLEGHPRFQFLRANVCHPLPPLPERLDLVFHLASPASPRAYRKHPLETMGAGSLGTFSTLELALERGATYLLASTSEVYGDPEAHPQREDYWGHVNPVGPRSVYDEAKRFAEALAMAYYGARGVDVRIARIFNTFGPRMRPDDGRMVPAFIRQALVGEPLTVYGDGSQTRSLCYVADTVEGLYRLATVENPSERVVNIGSPWEMTVMEIADLIKRLVGTEVPTVYLPLPEDDPTRRCPDISRAARVLQWEPHTPLEEGLKSTIAYFRELGTERASGPQAQRAGVAATGEKGEA